ncbi:hypothetical protein Y1Q_0003695 [Alligator mississippiensis]|uniref:Uncharacterized protein n=1 Tax=Alligator mississippiensis TaxID=8496 RepID=A0A151MJ14_ALLMI|nr:hypothetical protein Y1Q_0003695 [Alligator mississippiensis]
MMHDISNSAPDPGHVVHGISNPTPDPGHVVRDISNPAPDPSHMAPAADILKIAPLMAGTLNNRCGSGRAAA